MSIDSPTPTIPCCSRRSTSLRSSSSPTAIVSVRKQYFYVALTGLPYAEPPDWKQVEARLKSAVSIDGVRLDVIPDEFRPELAEASQFSELWRLYDSSYHSELSRWTNPYDTKQGIPPSALVSAEENERVDIGRNFPVIAASDRRVGFGDDHSKVVVLSTSNNDRLDVLQCGEMLSAVLLEATMAGLATCTLTHITEQHAGRNLVAALIDQTTTPQVLVRVGLAPRRRRPTAPHSPATS